MNSANSLAGAGVFLICRPSDWMVGEMYIQNITKKLNLRTAFAVEELERRRLLSAVVAATAPHLAPALQQAPPIIDGLIHTTARLSAARSDMAVATVGNYVLFAGGDLDSDTNSFPSSAVDVYNAATGQWSMASLSQSPDGITAAVVGHIAVFAGGDAFGPLTNAVEIFDADTGTWSTTTLPHAGADLTATTVGNLAIFVGGDSTTNGDQISIAEIYNASNGQWSSTTLPQALGEISATTVGDLAMFAGGEDSNGVASSVVDIYNASTSQWSTATLSQARSYIAATTIGKLAMFAGGQKSDGAPSSVVDIYDASTNRWSTAKLSKARSGAVAAATGDSAIFAGGTQRRIYALASKAVDIYNARTGQWSTGTLSRRRYYPEMTVVGSKVFIENEVAVARNFDIYNTRTGRWFRAALSKPSFGMAVAAVGNTAIFAGGVKRDFNDSDVVDLYTVASAAKPILNGSVALPHHGNVAVTLSNSGTGPLTAPYSVAVYASKTRTLGRGAVFLGKIDVRPSLDAGQTTLISAPFSIPKNAAPGKYHLIALAGPRHQLAQIASTRRTIPIGESLALTRHVLRHLRTEIRLTP